MIRCLIIVPAADIVRHWKACTPRVCPQGFAVLLYNHMLFAHAAARLMEGLALQQTEWTVIDVGA